MYGKIFKNSIIKSFDASIHCLNNIKVEILLNYVCLVALMYNYT